MLAGATVVMGGACGLGCSWDWEKFSAPTPTGVPPGNYQLTFREECEGQQLDPSRWHTEYVANDRTSRFRRYSWSGSWVLDANVSVDQGLCRIRVNNVPAGDAAFSSGTLDSSGKFEQQYGFFEVRLKALRGRGLSTSVTLQNAERWPPQISVVAINGDAPTVTHFESWHRAKDDEPVAVNSRMIDATDFSQDFHTFGLEWTSDRISLYVDGTLRGTMELAAPYLRFPMRLQVTAHVATLGGPVPDETTSFPNEILIDWIRVYRDTATTPMR